MGKMMKETMTTLKESGIRVTSQRLAIIEYLSNTVNHPSAYQIYSSIKKHFPNLSIATVYNNLRFLVKKGAIKELYVNGSSWYDYNTSDHYHLVCQSCGKIEDMDYPLFYEIEDFAEDFYGYIIQTHSLQLYGLCKACQKENEMHNCSNCGLCNHCL